MHAQKASQSSEEKRYVRYFHPKTDREDEQYRKKEKKKKSPSRSFLSLVHTFSSRHKGLPNTRACIACVGSVAKKNSRLA